jgi:IS5 family transposase
MTTRQRQEQQREAYRSLIGIAEEVVESAQVVLQNTSAAKGKDMFADLTVAGIRDEIEHYCDLGSRVINQARRRVLDGEQVANAEKIYSIFEPHTDRSSAARCEHPSSSATRYFSPKTRRV